MSKLTRWVVKAGSNMVCSGGPILMRAWMQQVAALRKHYRIEVIWVTSGAIASAVERTEIKRPHKLLSEKQALSAIGQPLVMDLYNLSLQSVGLLGAQVLLTADDLANKERRKNFQVTMEKLLEWKAIPILNENDTVATEEIKFGDNDSLSAKVAKVMNADRLIILTDVDGLFDADPKRNSKAKRIPQLKSVTSKLLASVERHAGSSRGTGGMYSKLAAAREASRHGIETWLVKADFPSALLSIAENKAIGTRIEAR